MAGARPLDTLRMTTGIAIGTLLLSGAILLGPAIRDCSDGQGSLSVCLHDKLVDRRLLPEPKPPVLDVAAPALPLEPPPSVEIIPPAGNLTAIVTGSDVAPTIVRDLAASGTLEVVLPIGTTLVPIAGELAATGGSMSTSVPAIGSDVATGRLGAVAGSLAALPSAPSVEGTTTVSLGNEQGVLAPTSTAAGIDLITTSTLTAPPVVLSGSASAPPLTPTTAAPFAGPPAALAASASTSESDAPAFAILGPLDEPEPPPLPRPRTEDSPVVEDPTPIPDPPAPPKPEPGPPALEDSPEFPSVTVLPPPGTGENSSIVTLSLDF